MTIRMSDKSKAFINKLEHSSMRPAADLIKHDIEKFSTDIVNMILRNRVKLEGNWFAYILEDINISYEEDMMKVSDLLNMYGVRDKLPVLESTDTALIANYQMTLDDAYGQSMDILNLIHVVVKGTNEYRINEWFFLYDI